jgi:hypothetical protein
MYERAPHRYVLSAAWNLAETAEGEKALLESNAIVQIVATASAHAADPKVMEAALGASKPTIF